MFKNLNNLALLALISFVAYCYRPSQGARHNHVCHLPKAAGGCQQQQRMFYYDQSSGVCQPFIYSGCGGNRNRFPNKPECVKQCGEEAHDICQLSPEYGNCHGHQTRLYYDVVDDTCKTFYFSGCGGNKNRFPNLDQCLRRCGSSHEIGHIPAGDKNDVCSLESNYGACTEYHETVYFDAKAGECKTFMYSGCGGNLNRFPNDEQCMDRCGHREPLDGSDHFFGEVGQAGKRSTKTPGTRRNHVCYLPKAAGGCQQQHRMFYYDQSSGVCKPFIYSGCGGNRNRFPSKARCARQCG